MPEETTVDSGRRARDPARTTVVLLLVFQVTVLFAVLVSAIVAFLEVEESCSDVFSGNSERRGEATASRRIVPGAVEVVCRTPRGVLTVPLNGIAAVATFACLGLLLTLVLGVAYFETRRRRR